MVAVFLQTKPAASPEVAAYRARMDHAQDLQDTILDGFESKDAKAIAAHARELADLLAEDERYWQRAALAPAIQLATESTRLSRQMYEDAVKGELAAAADDNKRLQQTCRSCHDGQFEKQVAKPPA